MFFRVMSRCEVIFWDVGQGDASSICLPDGTYILIDTGPNAKKGNPLPRWFAEHPDERIRKVVITHNHRDHFGGLSSLLEAGCDIDEVVMLSDKACYEMPTQVDFRLLKSALESKAKLGKIKLTWLRMSPYELFKDEHYSLTMVHPEALEIPSMVDKNYSSMIVRLDSAVRSNAPVIVWGGDALLKDVKRCLAPNRPEILMGPHHGKPQDGFCSIDTCAKELGNICPKCLFVSVGTSNAYNHPDRYFLLAATELGVRICCSEITERCGKFVRNGVDIYPGNLMLGIRKPPKAIECRGGMRVFVDDNGNLSFDECQSEFEEAVKRVGNRFCEKRGKVNNRNQ